MGATPLALTGTALAVALIPAAPASAAWTTPASTPALTAPQVVTGAAPGAAAVFGLTTTGSIAALAHTPGVGWGSAGTVLANSGSAEDGVTGPGGAFALARSGSVAIGRVTPTGTAGTVASLPGSDVSPIAVAASSDGTLVMLGVGAPGDLRAYAVAPGGTDVVRVGGSQATLAGADVGAASIIPTSASGFQAIWTVVPADGGPSVQTQPLTASALGAPLLTLSTPDLTVDDAVDSPELAQSGSTIIAGWVESDDTDGFARVRSVSAFDPAVDPETIAGDTPATAITLGGRADGTVLAHVAGDGTPSSAAVAVVAPDGSVPCTASDGGAFGVPVDTAAGSLLVHAIGDATLTLEAETIAPGACDLGAPDPGPAAADVGDLAAAADAEGTVVAVASADQDSTVAAYDRLPPAAATIAAPASVPPSTAFDASLAVSDAWGPVTLTWAVDGTPIGSGTATAIRVDGLPVGGHTLTATVRDQAGNTTVRAAAVTVAEDAPPPPPPTAPTPAPVTDAGTPVAPPQTVTVTPAKRKTPKRHAKAAAPQRAARVLGATLEHHDGAWYVRVRVLGAERVRLALFREVYKKHGRSHCGPSNRPHGTVGRIGVNHRVTEAQAVRTIRLSPAMQAALQTRGRYTVAVAAIAAGHKLPTTRPLHRRMTVC